MICQVKANKQQRRSWLAASGHWWYESQVNLKGIEAKRLQNARVK